jgi:hypothetical protein
MESSIESLSTSIKSDIIGFPFQYPDRRLALGIGLVCNKEVLFDKALREKSDLFVTFFTPADSADPLLSVYNLDVEETLVIKKHSVLLWNIAFKRGIAYILYYEAVISFHAILCFILL